MAVRVMNTLVRRAAVVLVAALLLTAILNLVALAAAYNGWLGAGVLFAICASGFIPDAIRKRRT